MMFGCSIKHSFETERQFPVILLIAKFWQFSSLRHKVEQVNVSLEKKKQTSKYRFFVIAQGVSLVTFYYYVIGISSI